MGINRGPADQFHSKNVANYAMPKSKAMSRSTSSWLADPETKRRKRVAKYKLVAMEGKAKQTVRNSFRWLKAKYVAVRYGVCVVETSKDGRWYRGFCLVVKPQPEYFL